MHIVTWEARVSK